MNPPKDVSESYFVAAEGTGFDVPHPIVSAGDVVSLFLETTRVVGTVDSEGFLTGNGLLHPDQGTLASTLVLTVRAQIDAGLFGTLGSGVDVEVILHRGTARERSLGNLVGGFGTGWQTFQLEVGVEHVKFPADPCPGQSPSQSCGREPVPRPNELSFVFTGHIEAFPLAFEVDWMTLEPKDQPGLAWRPVLLLHGLNQSAVKMQAGTAWFDGLEARDVACHAVDLAPKAFIPNYGGEITRAVDDLKRRFGVERVHIVGHSSGAIHAREHVSYHTDVETLIMLGPPNAGSLFADLYAPLGKFVALDFGEWVVEKLGYPQMTSAAMAIYNRSSVRNHWTKYVNVAGDYDSKWAKFYADKFGGNDEVVSVASVFGLGYGDPWAYLTSVSDPEESKCLLLTNHSCLRYYTQIVDDLFPLYMAVLTPPLPSAAAAILEAIPSPGGDTATVRSRRRRAAATAVPGSAATGVQGVMSDVGIAASGVTNPHTASMDSVDAASFLLLGDPDTLRLELVSPTGSRIDDQTPLVNPSVTATSFQDGGWPSFAGYYVEEPEVGDWTLEVTGTGEPSPDGGVYALAALALLLPDNGVVLTAHLDTEHSAVGGAVTITATLTEDGLPVTDATVTAVVAHPDGTSTTEVVLSDDGMNGDPAAGDGEYTGVFTATMEVGLYSIIVSAARTAPGFTREQLLLVSVAQSSSTFSGVISDRGVDADGDGRFDQLLVDVEVEVDVAAAYRVFGTLSDGAGTAIEQLRVDQHLQPGPQTVSLAFDGAPLFALGHDGPYLLEDLVLEDVATLTGLARGPAYTTAAYAHTDFQRPPLLLTGNASDHGAHDVHMDRLPYEELVVEVEVDTAVAVEVEATANLHAEDGTLVAAGRSFSSLASGLGMLAFRFRASQIFFGAGKPGPYTLQLLSMWGTAADGTPVSLQAPGVVAVTQPYRLEDFAPSPGFTVGGTVTGLIASGQLELELSTEGPPGTPATTTLRPRNGSFTFFLFPKLVSGNSYQVRVTQQPTNPVQVCTITNASGTIEDANVTNVEVRCV
jgi:pimeloyl-ACP methyl ester carboxylesterase